MTQDELYMQRALQIAAQAAGKTFPNPMVGAVIVKNGQVIADGWHEKAGLAHAEAVALAKAGENARGADLYVTLEPCSHQGRTGPCADAIIKAGVKRVYVAIRDPNPLVAGKGIERLKAAGVDVIEGLRKEEALKLNEVFLKWITTNTPFVACKYAMTLDGKIATKTGDSKWITGEAARRQTHVLRNLYAAILVGVGTVIADDPELTCRIAGGSNPVRIVLDSRARIPLNSKLLHDGQARTIVVTTELAPQESLEKLRETKAEVIQTASHNGRVDLKKLLSYLGENELTSVLVEGGGEVHGALFAQGFVDKVYAFIAPKIIGGRDALGPVAGIGKEKMSEAVELVDMEISQIAEDFLLTGYVKKGVADVYRASK